MQSRSSAPRYTLQNLPNTYSNMSSVQLSSSPWSHALLRQRQMQLPMAERLPPSMPQKQEQRVETAERPSTNEHQQLQQAKRLQELEQEPGQESQGTHRVSERRHVEYLHTRKAPNKAPIIDTRTLASPSYKIILGVSTSDVDLAYVVGLTSQRFKQFAARMEVRTPQGYIVTPAQLEGEPFATSHLPDPQPHQQSNRILWSHAESKRAAREHAEAERELMLEQGLRFDTSWRSSTESVVSGTTGAAHPLWWDGDHEEDEGHDHEDAEEQEDHGECCSCSCVASRLCGCLICMLRGCFGPHWVCFRSAAEMRRAARLSARRAERAKVKKALRAYVNWKSMV